MVDFMNTNTAEEIEVDVVEGTVTIRGGILKPGARLRIRGDGTVPVNVTESHFVLGQINAAPGIAEAFAKEVAKRKAIGG